MLYIAYFIYIVISFSTRNDDITSLNTIKVLQCLITGFLFVKFNFYLRISEQMSYLVVMMQGVFYDLRYFFLYFSFFMLIFAVFQAILISEDEMATNYSPLGPIGYIMLAFRTSVGDFDFATFD